MFDRITAPAFTNPGSLLALIAGLLILFVAETLFICN
jgi:hypothetical protein